MWCGCARSPEPTTGICEKTVKLLVVACVPQDVEHERVQSRTEEERVDVIELIFPPRCVDARVSREVLMLSLVSSKIRVFLLCALTDQSTMMMMMTLKEVRPTVV